MKANRRHCAPSSASGPCAAASEFLDRGADRSAAQPGGAAAIPGSPRRRRPGPSQKRAYFGTGAKLNIGPHVIPLPVALRADLFDSTFSCQKYGTTSSERILASGKE